MTDTVDVGLSNLETPRSPVSISTESSRRNSLKAIHPEKNSEPPTPSSPFIRLTRKRAASLNTESANQVGIADLALNSASTNRPATLEATREQVCLCQPDPKIPRPRNAFILYRQHYQAQAVAQHPGLANPEISKIIGEQWREQAPEVKDDWKRLAEEEKQRHQRQYPDYRYQPRRAGKPNGIRPVTSSSARDPIRCPKCNGRYISTPSTPLTPFTPVFGAGIPSRKERILAPFTPSRPSEAERPRYPTTQTQNIRMDNRTALPHQQTHRRPQYPQSLQTHHERDEEMDLLSPSPGQKRRRFNNDTQQGYLASPMSHSAPQQFARNGAPPMSAGGFRSQQLPGPRMIVRPGTMGPPPQHAEMVQQQRNQYPVRSTTFDESLRLPPLQTQVSSSIPISTQRPESQMNSHEIQAKSVEAMVMTIPYVNKIKVLTKISPPLAPPGPVSPGQEIRGAVVAVEGADHALLAEIGAFINEYLSKDSTCVVKTWSTSSTSPKQTTTPTPTPETEMTDAGASAPIAAPAKLKENDPFVEYLSVISEWHNKSEEMIKFITTAPSSPSSESAAAPSSTTDAQPKILPIALVSRGFSLTTSDTFALRIPINDSYAPVDHWQWMATLWRGIVGPDLTIYANKVGRDEMNKYGGVEIRGDCAAIIVRVPEGGKMDEKTARRLGFEVMEFVRGLESGFGRA